MNTTHTSTTSHTPAAAEAQGVPHQTLAESLATVQFGDLGPNDFVRAIYAGHDFSHAPLALRSGEKRLVQAAWSHPRGLMTWEGPIPDAVGRYVVVNPYSTAKLGQYDADDLLVGRGLTTDAIGAITTLVVEVDEAEDGGRMSMEEQAALYDGIEADSGLVFATAVLSGDARPGVEFAAQLGARDELAAGKSLHVSIAVKSCDPTPEHLMLRQEAADAFVALTNADAACRDVARKMRFGGVVAREQTCSSVGQTRVQTCIRTVRVAYPLQDVRDRMMALCQQRGIDVASRIAALQLVTRARHLARSWDRAAAARTVGTEEATDAAAMLREAALAVRRAGRVLDVQRRIIEAVGGPVGKVTILTASGTIRDIQVVSTGSSWDASTTIITHCSGTTGTAEQLWRSHLRGRRVPDVHCISHADANASAFLTRRKGGVFAVHCPACGSAFVSSPSVVTPVSPTIEAIDEADPAQTIEEQASRLLRDGRYGSVISLVACSPTTPSAEAFGYFRQAMLGEEGDEIEAARALKLSVYAERVAKKRAAAQDLDPKLVAGAQAAMRLSGDLSGPIRKKLRAEGLPLPDPRQPCGVHLGLHHFGDGRLGTYRLLCTTDSCPACGPVVIARRIAAVLVCPVTDRLGRVSGLALGQRPLWSFETTESSLDSLLKRWRRVDVRLSLLINNRENPTIEKVGHREVGHAFVAFHLPGQRVVVLSTMAIPGVDGQPIVGPSAIREFVVSMGTQSYRVHPDVEVDGIELPTVVLGKISSSHGLSLNPAGIARAASPSEWVSLGPVSASAVAAALEDRNISHKVTHVDGTTDRVEKVGTAGFVAPRVALEVCEAARTRRPHRPPSSPSVQPEPIPELDLDYILEDTA